MAKVEVPIPTYPPLVTMRWVVVEEPITNSGPVTPEGLTESKPHGEVVPIPTLPPVVAK